MSLTSKEFQLVQKILASFCMASELSESDELLLLLLSDRTQIKDNKYLEINSLETATELIHGFTL